MGGYARLDAEVHPDERVARFMQENFIPARLYVRDQAADFKNYGEQYSAHWTPTLLELDPYGHEQHRIEGFLEADDLLAQLTLGLGKAAFKKRGWPEAERRFREVVDRYPNSDAAAEAFVLGRRLALSAIQRSRGARGHQCGIQQAISGQYLNQEGIDLATLRGAMRTHPLTTIWIAALAVAGMACAQDSQNGAQGAEAQTTRAGAAAGADCTPLETREPNASGQRPAFRGQTRACGVKSNVPFEVTVLTKRLEHPWAVEPLPGGDLLVTEKPGRMRVVTAKGELGQPIAGVPDVDARGQGGLLDVALSPTFASDQTIYWSYSEPRQGGNATSVARGVLSQDRRRLEQIKVILRAMPTYDGDKHYGSRLAFGPDGMLYITLGERSDKPMRPQAQQLSSDMGKILRINPDGSIPKDNPFVGQSDARPEIWSLGHRNIQAATFDPQGRLWEVEHGTNGGDELNLVQKGKNYGWPLVAYGEEYSGQPIPSAVTAKDGTEQPVYYWDPVIAPSGMQFYTGDAFPAWKGSLFVGGMKDQKLVRLTLENDRVTGEEHLLKDRGQRVRDVRQGPDGALYIVTDQENGELWRVAPRG